MADSFDNSTKEKVGKIPLLSINAGPRDKDKWEDRLKEVCVCHTMLPMQTFVKYLFGMLSKCTRGLPLQHMSQARCPLVFACPPPRAGADGPDQLHQAE